MAIFLAYAKVLEPDDPTMLIYKAGLRACPGPALATIMPDGTVVAGNAFPAPPAPTS